MKIKDKEFLFLILIPTIAALVMLYITGLIPRVGDWYSFDQSFRLQTNAFLRGELSLNPAPYGHHYDWAWGNGIHQIWGLGVPILRLPFEILAKMFGSFGFPDRVVFVMLYFLVVAIFWKSICLSINHNHDLNTRGQFKKRIQNIPILIFCLINPAFINMIRTRFEPYEEVIAYGYLWSLMLFALSLLFLNKRKKYIFFLVCFLAGFSPNIRPTLISYGIVTFFMIFHFGKGIKSRWFGLFLFSSGIIFLLVTNYLRFNSPFEFGHKLILGGSSIQQHMMKFNNPVEQMPFLSAASELFSDLFFTDLHTPHLIDDRLLRLSNFPRIRDFYFKPYDLITPFILFLSWFIVALESCRKSSFLSHSETKIVQIAGLWSLCSFIMLFYFYMRFPVLSSRYFVDFGASIVIGIMALYLWVGSLIQYRFLRGILYPVLYAAVLSWLLISFIYSKTNPSFWHSWHRSEIKKMIATTADVAKKELTQARRATGPILPGEYRCKNQETKFDIPFNNQGWDISGSCAVSLTTTHFFDAPSCIAINIEPVSGVPEWMAKAYSDEEIEVKTGLDAMQRMSDVKSGNGKVITFCSSKKSNKGRKMELISIKWSDWRKHPDITTPPLRLISLSKVDKPKGPFINH